MESGVGVAKNILSPFKQFRTDLTRHPVVAIHEVGHRVGEDVEFWMEFFDEIIDTPRVPRPDIVQYRTGDNAAMNLFQ